MKTLITIKKTVLWVLYTIGVTHAFIVQADPIPLDEVVAIAERDAIMRSALDDRIAQTRLQITARNAPMPPDDVLTQQVLDSLVLESLQLQLAERAGIRVDDDTLNEQMSKIAEQNNMSLTQFSQELAKSGTTYPAVREQIRREMTIAQLRQRQISQRIRISDQEIDRALSSKNKPEALEYHLAAIVIKPSAGTPEAMKQAQQTANDIYNEAKNGRNFAQLAAAHSADANAKSGGDLGWRKASQLSTAIAQAISGLDAGDISPPFQDTQGISILKILEKRGSENASSSPIVEMHVRQILVSPSKIRNDEQTHKLITEIKQQLDQGADFSTLAKKYSDDSVSASAGGDLGWTSPKKEFVPEFTQVVESLPVNKISNPFKTKYGWHIAEVLEKRKQDHVNDEKENARTAIRKQKYEDELQMWLRQIRQEAFVDIKIK